MAVVVGAVRMVVKNAVLDVKVHVRVAKTPAKEVVMGDVKAHAIKVALIHLVVFNSKRYSDG